MVCAIFGVTYMKELSNKNEVGVVLSMASVVPSASWCQKWFVNLIASCNAQDYIFWLIFQSAVAEVKWSEALIHWLTVRTANCIVKHVVEAKRCQTPKNSPQILSFPSNFPVPSAMVCRGDLTSNWEFFTQQWQDYEVATSLDQKSQSIRLATFRSVMGKECLDIFLNLNCGTEELTINALEDYFLPKKNVVYERYVFNSCFQAPEESNDCYANRLRKLASSCQFGALTEEMTRDRLVIGIQDKSTKARLLREKDFSLDKALDMCKSSEITNKSIQHEEKQNNEELNLVQDKRRRAKGNKKLNEKKPPSNQKKPPIKPGPGKTWKCKYCG